MLHVDESVERQPRLLLKVTDTIQKLLQEEDTNHDMQITIDDLGPKV